MSEGEIAVRLDPSDDRAENQRQGAITTDFTPRALRKATGPSHGTVPGRSDHKGASTLVRLPNTSTL